MYVIILNILCLGYSGNIFKCRISRIYFTAGIVLLLTSFGFCLTGLFFRRLLQIRLGLRSSLKLKALGTGGMIIHCYKIYT